MSDRFAYELEIKARDAVRELTTAKKATGDLHEDLDDTSTSAKKLAATLETAADEMTTELAGATRTADKLAAALGPDMARKIGQARIGEWVATLRRAGIEFDDIEQNADQLATQLARLEDVKLEATSRGFTEMGNSAERARSVTANFVGNAAAELPGVADAFGPINQAASQFAEYLAEGDLKLADVAKAAGPMLVLGVAVAVVTKAFAEQAEARKRAQEAAEAAIDKDYDEAAKKLLETYGDLYDAAERIGVRSSVVTQALTGNKLAATQLADAFRSASQEGELWSDIWGSFNAEKLIGQLEHGAAAWESNTAAVGRNRALNAEVAGSLANLYGAERTTERHTRDLTDALDDQREAVEKLKGALDAEDQYNRLVLSLKGLGDELADLAEQQKRGEITEEERFRRAALAINARKKEVIDYGTEVLKLPAEMVTHVAANVTGAEADLERLYRKLELLQRIYTLMIGSTSWFSNGSGPTPSPSTPGGHGPDGESLGLSRAGNVTIIAPAGSDPGRWQAEQRRFLRRNGTTS